MRTHLSQFKTWINSGNLPFIFMAVAIVAVSSVNAQPVGWASVSGEGRNTTTGGAGGQTVTVTNETELLQAVSSSSPMIIRIQGTIAAQGDIRFASNKTVEGAGPGARFEGTLNLTGSSSARLENVIIRNLIIRKTGGSGEDAVTVRRAHHVWIDHNDIADSPDGLVDVTNGSDYVTVSWNRISYASSTAAHRFALLFGNSDNSGDEDSLRLRITLHNNWFAENVHERMPRTRFGRFHIFNNYFNSPGNNYCIGMGYQAQALVENNHFEDVDDPHIFYSNAPTARIAASGNCYTNTTGNRHTGQGTVFTPPYPYSLENCNNIPNIVTNGAGPQFTGTPVINRPALPGTSTGDIEFRDVQGKKLPESDPTLRSVKIPEVKKEDGPPKK